MELGGIFVESPIQIASSHGSRLSLDVPCTMLSDSFLFRLYQVDDVRYFAQLSNI
jgi:hypothetical protein